MHYETPRFKKGTIAAAILLPVLLILFLFLNPFVIINPGERGVVINLGAVQDTILEEGIHWRTPIVQSIKQVDVQTQKLEVHALAYSKDIQTVDSNLALNYHLKPDLVNKLWQEVGGDYVSRLIDPAVQESVKAATAQFTAQELIEQRPLVKDAIKVELETRLNTYFVVDEFSIVDFAFSDEYEAAIEAKQVAQQRALEQENVTKQVMEQAKQTVASAEAEAESIKIQAEALQYNNDLIDLRWVEKWDGSLPQYMFGEGTGVLLNLNQ